MAQITEHLVWAERVGVEGLWKALEAELRGAPLWPGERPWEGLPIEDVIAKTWQEKVEVPAVAAPREGGPLLHWTSALRDHGADLAELGLALAKHDLARLVYPHPISGPLDARQRLEFLRFHLDRHLGQAERALLALGG